MHHGPVGVTPRPDEAPLHSHLQGLPIQAPGVCGSAYDTAIAGCKQISLLAAGWMRRWSW